MTEMAIVTPRLEMFHQAQMEVLAEGKNIVKDDWRNMDMKDLLHYLKAEVMELEWALTNYKKDYFWPIKEATDVANFAFMIADKYSNEHENMFPKIP